MSGGPAAASAGLTLVLGGARSGKSELALRLAAASRRPVLYVATARAEDDEMAGRIAAHKAARPAGWRTVEEPLRVVEALRAASAGPEAFVVLDCLTLWVSNLMLDGAAEGDIVASVEALARWRADAGCELCVVSNEVGSGVVPPTELGRAFRDALGRANRAVASYAGRALLTVAGMAVDLSAAGARPIETFGGLPEAANA